VESCENKDGEVFATKEMLKARVLAKRSIQSVIDKRKILSLLKHGFVVNTQYAF
jgi:protein kinase A